MTLQQGMHTKYEKTWHLMTFKLCTLELKYSRYTFLISLEDRLEDSDFDVQAKNTNHTENENIILLSLRQCRRKGHHQLVGRGKTEIRLNTRA